MVIYYSTIYRSSRGSKLVLIDLKNVLYTFTYTYPFFLHFKLCVAVWVNIQTKKICIHSYYSYLSVYDLFTTFYDADFIDYYFK